MNDLLPLAQVKKELTITQKVGQCFMPAAFINDTEPEIQKLEALIREHCVGAICFFHSRASAATNYEGKKEVIYNSKSLDTLKALIERYQKAAEYPLLIAIDAEWGLAMRIEETPQYPYAITLGAIQNRPDLLSQVGKHIGMDCQEAGIHWNLCPAVDINNNPVNPVIGYRSFGDDPKKVFEHAKAFIGGMDTAGILNSIKHFPGHGDTAVDSHLGLPKIEKTKETLCQNEVYPFKALIDYGVDAVMVGHLAVPSLNNGKSVSATISKAIATDFLRGELGFDGVIITDALNMHSVSKLFKEKGELEWEAFQAGNDVLCFAENTKEGIDKIVEKIAEERIEASFERIWKLKEKAFKASLNKKRSADYENLMNVLAQASLTFLKGHPGAIEKMNREGFEYIQIGDGSKDVFHKALSQKNKNGENCVLAIFPREMKPTSNFGLSYKEVQQVNEIITNRNTTLYLFGNPYTLNLFDWQKAKNVIVVYQDFEAFQENAALHFLGKTKALGKLPVALTQNMH